MNNKKIRFSISLKQILLFSSLIIFVLGISTTLVSTLVRKDDRIKAEENNLTINDRTAETIKSSFDSLQNTSLVLFDAVSKINNKYEESLLENDFFRTTPSVLFLTSSDTGLKINPYATDFTASQDSITSFVEQKRDPSETVYLNAKEILGRPSIVFIFNYDSSSGKKFGAIGLDTESLANLMSTGSNNTTLLVDKKSNILINPDYENTATVYEPAVALVNEIYSNKDENNSQSLIEGSFVAAHQIKDSLFVITSITEKSVYAVINKTTYRIILLSLAVLFLAIILIRIFSNQITNPIKDLVDASGRIEKGDFNLNLEPRTNDELGLLTSSFNQMGRGLAEREKLMTSFSKFTNKTIAQKAASGELALGGENRNATIFFSDIRSFTAMSEKMQPHEVVEFLNAYMTRMVECVNKTNGIVDKYIGDAIMAVWGAPESAGNPATDAYNAVSAALMMRSALYSFNNERKAKGLPPVKIGCGINSGPVVAGQIGSDERMEYTVIGDAVNLASRTEALNKPFATDILITENTYNLIKNRVIVEEMPGVHVKGKNDLIKMYAVINIAGRTSPSTMDEVRKIIGTTAPDLSKVNTDDEEKKYNIQAK